MKKKIDEKIESNVPAIAPSDDVATVDDGERLPVEAVAPVAESRGKDAAEPRREIYSEEVDADENMTGGYASVKGTRRSDNKMLWTVIAVMCAMCIAVGVCCSLITATFMRRGITLPTITPTDNSGAIAAVVKSRKPCVVEVIGGDLSCGSGVITEIDGNKIYIVTNTHVAILNPSSELGNSVKVRLYGEDNFYFADVVGYSTQYDVAVLRLERSDYNTFALVGESGTAFDPDTDYAEGDGAVAIGNAMGMGIAAYDGIVSRSYELLEYKGRRVPVMRTTAAINAGMSGGALFDLEGRFIGLGSYRMSGQYSNDTEQGGHENDVEDTGFAIPVSIVYSVYKQILAYGDGGEIGGLPVMEFSVPYGDNPSAIGQIGFTLADFGVFTATYKLGKLTVTGLDVNLAPKGLSEGDVINKIGEYAVTADICRTAGEILRYRYNAGGDSLVLETSGGRLTASRYARVV